MAAGEAALTQGEPMHIDSITLREVRMRLLHPFETSFGVTEDRRIVIVEVREGATIGYGEVTAAEGPFYSHETPETAWHVLSDFVIPRTVGRDFACAADFASVVHGIRGHNMAKAGVETALWDLEARQAGVPLWKLLGGQREEIDCGVSIGIQSSVDRLLEKIQTEVDAGYRRIKMKIKPGRDVEDVAAVRDAFPDLLLMADANSAYSLDDFELLKKLDGYDLMMIEQPLHWEDIVDHAALGKKIRTPICLDESIHSADDARKAIQIGACHIVNLKLGRVGGHRSARAVHDICRDRGVPVWCGGMLESGVGRAHNVAMSSLDNFTLPGDVSASQRYWEEDLIAPEVEVTPDGRIGMPTGPGIGFRPRIDFIDSITHRHRLFAP